jgi:hypothetical protein
MEANGKRLRTTMTATGDNFMNHLEAIVRIKSAANVFALPGQVKQILLLKISAMHMGIRRFRDSVRTAISLACAENGLAAIIDANCNIQRPDHAQKSVDPLRLRRYLDRIIRTKTCVAAGTRSSDLAALAERGAGSSA